MHWILTPRVAIGTDRVRSGLQYNLCTASGADFAHTIAFKISLRGRRQYGGADGIGEALRIGNEPWRTSRERRLVGYA